MGGFEQEVKRYLCRDGGRGGRFRFRVRALRQRWMMGRGECFVFCFVSFSSGNPFTHQAKNIPLCQTD